MKIGKRKEKEADGIKESQQNKGISGGAKVILNVGAGMAQLKKPKIEKSEIAKEKKPPEM